MLVFPGLRAWPTVLLCSVLSAAPARAEAVDDTTKAAARDIAQRGAAAYDAGDYKTAQDLFRRAYALVPAPTLSLREARSLEKLGRYVEALEAYVRIARTRIGPDAPDVFQQSIREAKGELVRLRPRVPRLKITVEGAGAAASGVRVTIDGRAVPPELLGVESLVDPGTHTITAVSAGGERAEARVTIAASQSKSARLVLNRAGGTAQPGGAGAATLNGDADEPTRTAQRTWGFVALGVGGAGLAVGLTTGILATQRHTSAEDSCPGGRCSAGSPGADDVEAFRTLRTVSTVGYVVGALGIAGGAALLLTLPERRGTRGVRPYLGLGTTGLAGNF